MVKANLTYRSIFVLGRRSVVRSGSILLIMLLMFCLNIPASNAQSSHFAQLTVSQKQVMTGQPFSVRITVYTPTWFTKAPNFGEYQVENSFTLRSDRAQSLYETINGKRYTTLYYEYYVFPLKEGKLHLPPVHVQFESPEEGDYKGKLIKVTTKGASVEVIPLPGDTNKKPLFVANNVSLKQSWNRSTSDLEVGDVLERIITISTSGTLANMIPPTQIDTLTWASIYVGRPDLSQTVNYKTISSERKEKYTYLLENEGVHTIPEVELSYFNINTRKWVTRKISALEVAVADNPDLYALKTLQDSLNVSSNISGVEEKGAGLILGFTIKTFLLLLLTLLAVGYLVYFFGKRFYGWVKIYRVQYLKSERYYFKQLKGALSSNNSPLINETLYNWLSVLDPENPIISISDLAGRIGNKELESTISAFQKGLFGKQVVKGSSTDEATIKKLKMELVQARKDWLQQQKDKQVSENTINYNLLKQLNSQ